MSSTPAESACRTAPTPPDARPRVVGIVQARMNSSRLPGKVLKPVAGRPLLQHHLDRLRRSARLDAVVLATTSHPNDDPVAALAESIGVPVARGSEQDVLDRYHQAAKRFDAEYVVRTTADCPLIDAALIDGLVDAALTRQTQPDYVAIDILKLPRGLDAEMVRFASLDRAWREATKPSDREHVTPFIWADQERFRAELFAPALPDSLPEGPHRWCVDTAEDLDLVSRLLGAEAASGQPMGWQEFLGLLRDNPSWASINRAVKQKELA